MAQATALNTPVDLDGSAPRAMNQATPVWTRRFPVASFAPISLAEMDSVALLDRRDTKYVISPETLASVLEQVRDDYRILDIGGVRLHPYRTVYFDTPEFDLYYDHHRRRPLRYKVRSRTYACSGASFFELKRKDKRERTSKVRIPTPCLTETLGAREHDFLAGHAPSHRAALRPTLTNDFHRITLVSKHQPERLTLDLGLRFETAGAATLLPGVAIAEVKEVHGSRGSSFVRAMREQSLHPCGFSKYCVGAAMHYPHLKHNNFNPELRLVNRLSRGTTDVCS